MEVAIPPLGEVSSVRLRRLIFNLSKRETLPMRLEWFAEKYIEPRLEPNLPPWVLAANHAADQTEDLDRRSEQPLWARRARGLTAEQHSSYTCG